MDKLGERLRTLRGKVPRDDFANFLGVSSAALFNYESGERVPGAELLQKICTELEVNAQWLLLGTGPIYNVDWLVIYHQAARKVVDVLISMPKDAIKDDPVLSFVILVERNMVDVIEEMAGDIMQYKEDDEDNFVDGVETLKSKLMYAAADERYQEQARSKVVHAATEKYYSEQKQEIDTQSKQGRKKVSSNTQIAKGSNIIQSGGDIHGGINIKSTNKKVNIEYQPPHGTIGANAALRERIQGLFNELGLRREERFGKSAYPVMYSEFKKAFTIPRNQKYTAFLLWPESRSTEIIEYLEEKLDNTIKGRKQKAASRKGHTAPYLLGETSRLHKLLGLSEQEYRAHLHYMFGVTSRSELSQSQLANYVAYLKEQVDERD
jgi:transcriptional regulator with XRE-family HTH domain